MGQFHKLQQLSAHFGPSFHPLWNFFVQISCISYHFLFGCWPFSMSLPLIICCQLPRRSHSSKSLWSAQQVWNMFWMPSIFWNLFACLKIFKRFFLYQMYIQHPFWSTQQGCSKIDDCYPLLDHETGISELTKKSIHHHQSNKVLFHYGLLHWCPS